MSSKKYSKIFRLHKQFRYSLLSGLSMSPRSYLLSTKNHSSSFQANYITKEIEFDQ